jgi:hypothetical protein
MLSAVVGFAGLASLGCKNATHGRCDCQYDPANAQLQAPSNPYPTVGAPVGNAPKAMPLPATEPAPKPLPKN